MRGPCFTVSEDRIMAKRDSVTRFSTCMFCLKVTFFFRHLLNRIKQFRRHFRFREHIQLLSSKFTCPLYHVSRRDS